MVEMNLVLYLAHPFDSRHRMREWELKLESEWPIDIINPFFDVVREDKDVIEAEDVTLTTQATRKDRYGLSDEDCAKLVWRDRDLICSSDGMIAIVDGSLSYGTIQEMVYAGLADIPVYSVISNGHIGHPWLRYHSTETFETIEQLTEFLKGV